MKLTSLTTVKDLLERYGLEADKRFGQNFLVDANLLDVIVAAASPQKGIDVYEVGPGLGTLTRALAETGARVNTIEMDLRLAPVLAETLANLGVEITWGDALKFDWEQVPSGSLFVGNLPYNVATPLITQLLISNKFTKLVVLVQKEVAQRMVAMEGSPDYGILSLRMAYHAKAKRLRDFPAQAFYPAPKILSSLVLLESQNQPDDPDLFNLIETGFAHRRKTLRNNLLSAGYTLELIEKALIALGLGLQIRAEALNLKQFQQLKGLLQN